jgi:hypothetical protein
MEPDVLEFGGPPRRRRVPLWARWLILGVVAVIALVAVPRARHNSAPPAATASSTPAAASAVALPAGPAPTVIRNGGPLLDVRAGWELFARGPDGVARIELAAGRVTWTRVPPLNSSGPTAFLVGSGWAMVRPLDNVAGYLVQDGRPAVPLPGELSRGGEALPGPDPTTAWLNRDQALRLMDLTGRPNGRTIPIPQGLYQPTPDGTGYALLIGTGGVYLATPAGLTRVTSGQLLAAGPTYWLVRECDATYQCQTLAVDRLTGTRQPVAMVPGRLYGSLGRISPDGALAAVLEQDRPDARPAVHLIDLHTGTDRRPNLALYPAGDGAMAWAPDSRWLFVANEDGRIWPLQAATAKVLELGAPLPLVNQIAIRNG